MLNRYEIKFSNFKLVVKHSCRYFGICYLVIAGAVLVSS